MTALSAKGAFKDDGYTIAVIHLDRVPTLRPYPVSPDRVYTAIC